MSALSMLSLVGTIAFFTLPCEAILSANQVTNQAKLRGSNGFVNFATQDASVGPTVFVVAFSFSEFVGRRIHMRKTWKLQGLNTANSSIIARFGICADNHSKLESLRREREKFGDVLLFSCQETSNHYPPPRQEVTKKLVAAMQVFDNSYSNCTFFATIEDDTFVPWNRFTDHVKGLDVAWRRSFMGVPVEHRRVNRDPDSPYYTPEDMYPAGRWPTYMQRLGYVIGSTLVQDILKKDIAQKYLVSNEDQAAGAWVHELDTEEGQVSYVELPARYKYDPNDEKTAGIWKDYRYLLHHDLKRDFWSCLAELDGKRNMQGNVRECFVDSFFVGVFTARANQHRRHVLRKTISRLSSMHSIGRFILCKSHPFDGLEDSIEKETQEFDDILLLDCEEGYNRTLLTRKMLKALQAYHKQFSEYSMFMKTDDDTFVAWSRLRNIIFNTPRSEFGYMGLQGPDTMPVNRNTESLWYQPEDSYPNETYPTFMEGGPGYLLGRELVKQIIDTGVAESHILSNEDQATGVWVNMLKDRGVPIQFVNMVGSDGYRPENDMCSGPWRDYPFLLHHHLDAETIDCLNNLDETGDGDALIETCFPNCEALTAQYLGQRLEQVEGEINEVLGALQAKTFQWQQLVKRMGYLSKINQPPEDAQSLMRAKIKYPQASLVVQDAAAKLVEVAQQATASLEASRDGIFLGYRSESESQGEEEANPEAQEINLAQTFEEQASDANVAEACADDEISLRGWTVKTCAEQKSAGYCDRPAFVERGFCNLTCGRCLTNEAAQKQDESNMHAVSTNNVNKSTLTLLHIPLTMPSRTFEEVGVAAKAHMPKKMSAFWRSVKMDDGSKCPKYHVPPQYLPKSENGTELYTTTSSFCVSRHPYERAVTQYLYLLSVPWGMDMSEKYGTGLFDHPGCSVSGLNYFLQRALAKYQSGKKFLHDCHFVPQAEFIWGSNGQQWCQNVLRADELPSHFNQLMKNTGNPVRAQWKKKGEQNRKKGSCQTLSVNSLSKKTLNMLNEVYAEDFVKLNYEPRDVNTGVLDAIYLPKRRVERDPYGNFYRNHRVLG